MKTKIISKKHLFNSFQQVYFSHILQNILCTDTVLLKIVEGAGLTTQRGYSGSSAPFYSTNHNQLLWRQIG